MVTLHILKPRPSLYRIVSIHQFRLLQREFTHKPRDLCFWLSILPEQPIYSSNGLYRVVRWHVKLELWLYGQPRPRRTKVGTYNALKAR